MALEIMRDDVRIIQGLSDYPNQEEGLSSGQMKAKFDEAAVKLQSFINNSVVPAVNDKLSASELSGAVADTVEQTLGSITPDKIGAAPAGYGLGLGTGDITQLTTAAQVDAAMEAGWYQYYGSNINGNGTAYGGILVVPSMWSVTQFFFCRQHYGSYMKRIYQSNAWNPWEWINPPMLAGVEYRTTERYMGKPVYAKLVDCKGMPSGANAAKTVQHNSANVESIVSFGGNMSVGGTKAIALPYYSSDTNLARISVDTLQVRISNGGTDLVGYNDAKVWFKYTKTTA